MDETTWKRKLSMNTMVREAVNISTITRNIKRVFSKYNSVYVYNVMFEKYSTETLDLASNILTVSHK